MSRGKVEGYDEVGMRVERKFFVEVEAYEGIGKGWYEGFRVVKAGVVVFIVGCR